MFYCSDDDRAAVLCLVQGGSSILEAVRGAEDVTALFESYHALANTEDIRQRLQKFEWAGKVGEGME